MPPLELRALHWVGDKWVWIAQNKPGQEPGKLTDNMEGGTTRIIRYRFPKDSPLPVIEEGARKGSEEPEAWRVLVELEPGETFDIEARPDGYPRVCKFRFENLK